VKILKPNLKSQELNEVLKLLYAAPAIETRPKPSRLRSEVVRKPLTMLQKIATGAKQALQWTNRLEVESAIPIVI